MVDLDAHPLPPPTTAHRQPQRHEPAFDLRAHLYRITGVDLTQVPGFQALTIHTILSEVGLDMSKWPTDKHFASWLGLCPDNRISGGKVLATGSRRVQNRASRALRMAAQSLRKSPSYLGAFYRRMRSKLGPAKATTATAHKLAKILYHMLQEKTPIGNVVPRRIGIKSTSGSSDNSASKPSTSDLLWYLKQAINTQADRRDERTG